ncbi:hypothetical protein ACILG0_22765 [Pseudomonadota bacterium AL_CKDN230030165-1A_HGKHYDSX7]
MRLHDALTVGRAVAKAPHPLTAGRRYAGRWLDYLYIDRYINISQETVGRQNNIVIDIYFLIALAKPSARLYITINAEFK